jgi:GSH-dependent disulfide-bond oxidoreductase
MGHVSLAIATNFVPEKTPSTIQHLEQRLVRFLIDLDRQFGETEYLAGDVSLADFGLYPIFDRRRDLIARASLKNLSRWGRIMDARPACRRGLTATE